MLVPLMSQQDRTCCRSFGPKVCRGAVGRSTDRALRRHGQRLRRAVRRSPSGGAATPIRPAGGSRARGQLPWRRRSRVRAVHRPPAGPLAVDDFAGAVAQRRPPPLPRRNRRRGIARDDRRRTSSPAHRGCGPLLRRSWRCSGRRRSLVGWPTPTRTSRRCRCRTRPSTCHCPCRPEGSQARGHRPRAPLAGDAQGGHGHPARAMTRADRRRRQHQRPPAGSEGRTVPGHWEGDLLAGGGNTHSATLMARHFRFVILAKVPPRPPRLSSTHSGRRSWDCPTT